MMAMDMSGAEQGREIKQHIAELIAHSDGMAELQVAMRYVMDNYCLTGAERDLGCETIKIDLGSCSGEWFMPPQADLDRRILYVHGGGWFAGSIDTHRHLIDRIARTTKRPVLAVNYRLAPEHPFPAGLDDARRAFAWASANGPDGPSKASHITLMGDSAGGNISAALVVDLLTRGDAPPDALILLSGVVDFRPPAEMPAGTDDPTCSPETQVEIAKLYLQGITTVDDPRVSPATADCGILAKFPPTLVQVSSDEYLRDQDVAFATALWSLGVTVHLSIWAHQPHAFQLFPQELTAARQAIEEIGNFLSSLEKPQNRTKAGVDA